MKIIADENMTAVEALFSPYGEIELVPGRTLEKVQLADCDALLVRSVTRVDRELLDGSAVRFVGSATIGTDHIDHDYLKAAGIAFAHAPGCNAEAVVDYVLAVLFEVHESSWFDKTVAIVGCGNVGSRLYGRLRNLGVKCICYDPFLDDSEQPGLCDFEDLPSADILCLHTPLTTDGPYPTYHLCDAQFLAALKPGSLLINAGRGAVIDNEALLPLLEAGQLKAVLDVWEDEPNITRRLADAVTLGSPHIAGYSLEGRLRGTLMIERAFSRWISPQGGGMSPSLQQLLTEMGFGLNQIELIGQPEAESYQQLRQFVMAAYRPSIDYARVKALFLQPTTVAIGFDRLRKDYPLRREFGYCVPPQALRDSLDRELSALGFCV